ncbi:MAG TPA: hypothetical protein VIT90_14315 [Lysobacter sp.]
MAKGISSGGVDFDDLFDPDVKGDGSTAWFVTSAGVALRYAKLSYGSKRADVGWRDSAGTDLSNYWAAKGTARYALPINGQTYSAGYSAPTNQTGTAFATVTVALTSNGIYTVTRGTRTGSTQLTSGTWETSPGSFDVRMIAEDNGGDSSGGYLDTGYRNAGTSASRTVSVPSASAQSKEAYGRIRILIARAGQGDGGIVSDTTMYTYLAVNGWV